MAAGAVLGALLAAALGTWSNGFAVSGLVLTLGAIGWAIGPFKTPMAWSEGALMTYQGNAEMPANAARPSRWHVIAAPAFVLVAGLLLLAVGAVLVVAAGD